MDTKLQEIISENINDINRMTSSPIEFESLDPVAKLMFVSVIGEIRKNRDKLESLPERITEHFCSDFIPQEKVRAMPAFSILGIKFRSDAENETVTIDEDACFTYKDNDTGIILNYMPLFESLMIPHRHTYTVKDNISFIDDDKQDFGTSLSVRPDEVWFGIETEAEIHNMLGVPIMINGTHGILPEHIYIRQDDHELDFCEISSFEKIKANKYLEAQQSSASLFSVIDHWNEIYSSNDEYALIYITSKKKDRDIFKPKPNPHFIAENDSGHNPGPSFPHNVIWMRFEFPDGYRIPDDLRIRLNAIPIVNLEQDYVFLTQSSPIAKLQVKEGSQFIQVLDTSSSDRKNGYAQLSSSVFIRDFDTSVYDSNQLYRDVRSLYYHFIDDYHAFIDYHDLRDEKTIKTLRETVNKLSKSADTPNNYRSGTYVMLKPGMDKTTSSIKVSYLSTQGKDGNRLKAGFLMDNSRLPSIETKLPVFVSARGGSDKSSPNERYELMRYFTLTNDRLFTKKDIEAFLRSEITSTFGKEEYQRISIKMSIEGAAGERHLQRGLYIDIEFKDAKNYNYAKEAYWDRVLLQKILNRSCISMPIIVTLKNGETI